MKHLSLFCVFFFTINVFSQPGIPHREKVLIKEAIRINTMYGEKIWEGMMHTPFPILLVTDEYEYLVFHSKPPSDFNLLHYDSFLETDILYRKKILPTGFLATFPLGGISCIVVGIPENTNKTPLGWMVALLHEHFHQFQTSQPDYFEAVNNLDLAGDDQTGGWMLNYPFPYEDYKVVDAYEAYTNSLKVLALAESKKNFKKLMPEYLKNRQAFKSVLSDKEYAYFSFQLWQEGIARHTEYSLLLLLKNYKPSKEYKQLFVSEPINQYWKKVLDVDMGHLTSMKLSEKKRVCFYAAGFAEGLVLDRLNKNWRRKYLAEKFFIENYSDK